MRVVDNRRSRALWIILLVFWSIWFGGMISLLLFVVRLFRESHELGANAAPVLFRTFADFQLLIGAITACGAATLALLTRRNAHAICGLLLIASLICGVLIHRWTIELENLRLAGSSSGPRFVELHRRSSIAYTTAATLLLITGVGLLFTPCLPRRTDSEILVA